MQKSVSMTNTRHSDAANELSALFHADALPLGTMLGEFDVTGLLGVGGFGMVYDAFDHSLQRMVAIKEYMPCALAGRADGPLLACRSSTDQDALSAGLVSFIAEARLLAQFDHPSLVKVYRFWEANNTAYMVMPLYKGLTLKNARTQAQSPPPEDWLRPMLWSVLRALKYLHAHNVVHRDISPDNIFLQEAGPPVLLDLGAARRAIGETSQKHTAILKVNYAPIEQYADASDLPQGPWTDLYALAAVVHGSLCNAQPLPATFRVVRDRLPPFASVAKTVESIFGQEYSVKFVQAFSHALEIQPQDRPQSVQAFIDEMGLAAPVGPQTMSWRSQPMVGNAIPVVDSEAKTVYQVTRPPVTTVDAPSTDNSPLEIVSAYGVLEQESPLLLPNPQAKPEAPTEPVGAPQPGKDTSAPGAVKNAKVGEKLDAVDTVRKVKAPSARRASAKAAPVAAAPTASSRVKMAVIATVCAVALLAGAVVWNAKGKRTEPQVAQPPAAAPVPVPVTPVEAAKSAAPPLRQETVVPTTASTSVPVASSSSPLGAGAAQKPNASAKTPARATEGNATGAVGASGVAGAAAAAKAKPIGRTTPPVADASVSSAKPAADASVGAVASAPAPAATVPAASTNPLGATSASAARVRAGPSEICAEKNFLVRPMCIHQECQKPEFAQLAFCIDNARRLRESARPAER